MVTDISATAGTRVFGRLPLSNIVPFTYRDGLTYANLLYEIRDHVQTVFPEKMQALLNDVVTAINSELAEMGDQIVKDRQDLDRLYSGFTVEIERRIMNINNRVGPETMKRRVLNNDYTLDIDPVWPDAHPINFQYTQNSTGGHRVLMGNGISGEILLDYTPNSTSEFTLIPLGNGKWKVDENSLKNVRPTNVYVNPVTGDDKNSGTVSKPLKTVNEGIRRAEIAAGKSAGWQPTDPGVGGWVINLAPGTYTERVWASSFTPFALNITIQGPRVGHPYVPKVIFTEGAGTSAAAFKFSNPNAVIVVKDIKFIGYNGTTSSAAINSVGGQIWTDNVHVDNCYHGVSSQFGQIDVKGGIFENCGKRPDGSGTGMGIRSMMLNRHSIGYQYANNLSYGPIFKNNHQGIFIQESSTGHVDFCTFEDNDTGVVLRVNSRANLGGSHFGRNLTAISADSNSHAYVPKNTTFGIGSQRNQQGIVLTSGSTATGPAAIHDTENAYSRSEEILRGYYKPQTVTGSTNRKVLMEHVLRNEWFGDILRFSNTPSKRIKIRAAGFISGQTGTAGIILRIGPNDGSVGSGTVTINFAASDQGTFIYEGYINFAGPDKVIMTAQGSIHLSPFSRVGVVTHESNSTEDQRLTLEAVLGSASDVIAIELIELSI